MKIVCATNMPYVEEAFRTLGDPVVLEGRSIGPDVVRDADVLAIRSTTRVTRALLEGSRLRHVGTATIGTDHLDIPALEALGIAWSYAPGCNANSVGEYVLAALLEVAAHRGEALAGRTLGIVGVGNVGRRVEALATAAGLRVLRNDPPRARAEGVAAGPFVELDALLAASDFVTVHVPLDREGPDATWHLCDAAFFARMRPGSVFLNAARGAVVDTPALLRGLDAGRPALAVLDTWEGEPVVPAALVTRAFLATPHIAGYSHDGKVAGTAMVYEAVCRTLGETPRWSPAAALAAEARRPVDVSGEGEAALRAVVRAAYDVRADDARFRAAQQGDDAARGVAFDWLRATYPVRREFASHAVRGVTGDRARVFARLGFALSA